MIIPALSELYDRLSQDPDVTAKGDLPTIGKSRQKISFRIILKPDGTLVGMDDIRAMDAPEGKKAAKLHSIPILVLGSSKPSGSGLNPCFLWDNCGYLLGYKGETGEKEQKRIREAFSSFRDKHLSVESSVNHPHFSAVCRFLEQWDPGQTPSHLASPDLWISNGIFRIAGEMKHVHETPEIQDWWFHGGEEQWQGSKKEKEKGICLVSGKEEPLALLHEPAIKGVLGAQVSGAKIVSFNCSSFTSYGKDQSLNAPVGENTAFAYCNALNYLLSHSQYNTRIGDASVVFWADAPKETMDMEAFLFGAVTTGKTLPPAMDQAAVDQLSKITELLRNGELSKGKLDHADVPFFILGISPNASRLSIRFWYQSTFGELMENIQTHYRDISLARQWTEKNSNYPDPELPKPFDILKETVRDMKELPSLYSGVLMKSILFHLPYPDIIAQAIIRRIRIDKKVNYIRCSLLKGWLYRKTNNHDLTTMQTINPDNHNIGYLLGRLFAVYVKTQEDALGKDLNRTVRDSYFSSMCAHPRSVYSTVNKLYQYHLKQLVKQKHGEGTKINREKLVQEIKSHIPDNVPVHMGLEQQAYFDLGFYHQMNDFFTEKEISQTTKTQTTDNNEQN